MKTKLIYLKYLIILLTQINSVLFMSDINLKK